MWEALVELDRSRTRVGDQLVGALREAIGRGRLAPGTRLPSTRDLAADLGVSRGVVVGAYEQLVAEGRLVTRRGFGTTVATLPAPAPPGPPAATAPARSVAPLRPGVPDLGMFPRNAWRRAYERALATALDVDFGYGDAAGVPRLREELAGYLGRVRAALVPADGLIVTAGVTQGLALLSRVLLAEGVRRVAVEDPGPAALRDHLVRLGMEPVAVPVDAAGLDTAALARTGVRAVLLTPAHQFPTGVVLAPRRRAELLAWAGRTDALVVEDDYDAEYRYDRDPVGCLQGLAPERVALVGSVSKVLAPGLRLGWLVAPPAWLDRLRAVKADADNGGPAVEQLAFAEFLAGGGYDRHLRRARRIHRQRRDALVAAVRRHLPYAKIAGIAAGLHLVVELPAEVDDEALAAEARTLGLGPIALSSLRSRPGGPPGLVLGYAPHTTDELTDAVRLLATSRALCHAV
ncbi:MocR-like pyridoxine biosynthesis transcription factor PdxR [Couchioplanes caeruleus]|uniref:GntR family transcriptional regulator n=1 Tax=Couchioplanes caeruleus subsp. caeruleus TaxID=56427 RepID=A0A1K0FTX1_9ACTN|nr:PLP-dependent aminotransferase family protein [Couchioplanes caeruleus]OJF16120.1 GntR family transcriptional regulator [Couchioplanes caeruleus subsp. caeruleus]